MPNVKSACGKLWSFLGRDNKVLHPIKYLPLGFEKLKTKSLNTIQKHLEHYVRYILYWYCIDISMILIIKIAHHGAWI